MSALLAFVLCLPSASPPAKASVFQRQALSPSVALSIATPAGVGLGSGTVVRVGDERLILTCAHVVAIAVNPREVRRLTDKGEVRSLDRSYLPIGIHSRQGKVQSQRSGHVVFFDKEADLALIRPACSKGLVPALMASVACELECGEPCWYCGSGGGLRFSLVRSIVNQDDEDWTTVNGEGWYGHSGSGVFVRRGGKYLLCGVVARLHGTGANPKAPVRCVNRAEIAKFLKGYTERHKCTKSTPAIED